LIANIDHHLWAHLLAALGLRGLGGGQGGWVRLDDLRPLLLTLPQQARLKNTKFMVQRKHQTTQRRISAMR
jgi:hypothetical protein